MKTYIVTGTRPFLGHQPGETFEAELAEWEEGRAVARGSISVGGGLPTDAPDVEAPVDPVKRLLGLTRPELDARAQELELDPEGFANKTELAEAIVTAIDDDSDGDNKTPDESGDDE